MKFARSSVFAPRPSVLPAVRFSAASRHLTGGHSTGGWPGLAAKHPELGITAKTEWTPRFVSTLLVVSQYAYYSDEWELTVAWHDMIPPHDWTDIHLRHRGTEAVPGLAFRQDSIARPSRTPSRRRRRRFDSRTAPIARRWLTSGAV